MNVGDMRRQCAFMDASEKVVIVVAHDDGSKVYYQATRVWPDTAAAPAGSGFYVETRLDPIAKI